MASEGDAVDSLMEVYVARVLNYLKTTGPIAREKLPVVLQDVREGFDLESIWEAAQKSPYAKLERNNELHFEHELVHVRKDNLRDFVEKKKIGVAREDLVQFNASMRSVANELLRSAEVMSFLGWRGSNLKTLVMYPRGTDFKVRLSCTVSGKEGSTFIEATHDLTREVRRGDAIVVNGQVYRVAIEESTGNGDDADDVPESARGAASAAKKSLEPWELLERVNEMSSSSIAADALDHRQRNAFATPAGVQVAFEGKKLPLDKPLASTVENQAIYKFGCTNDIRDIYWKIAGNAANNFDPREAGRLDDALIRNNCLTEETLRGLNHNQRELLELRAKRLADQAKGEGRKKQRRANQYRKITNEHML